MPHRTSSTRNNYEQKINYSQFNAFLNGIICFSVRFCSNSLLMLKMHFRVFSFVSKNVQGSSDDRKMLMLL